MGLACALLLGSPALSADERAGTPLADPRFDAILERAAEHRVQLLVATIDDSTTPPRLVRHGYRADAEYFYPASSIKLCAAVGALLRLQELGDAGVPVDADTPLVFHPLFEGESLEDRDESNLDGGTITVAHEIRKLFIVSDNRAFNRLLGFVGRDDLNRMMWEAGLGSVRVSHRLGVGLSAEQNRRMPRVDLVLPDGSVRTIPERLSTVELDNDGVAGLEVGTAEMVGGERLDRPKSFLRSNRVSLVDLQDALVMVVRPEVDLGKKGFALSERHRLLLIDAMTRLPRESLNPVYDAEKYPDHWVKFLLPGLRRVFAADRVGEVGKIGLAYGFTSVTAGLTLDGGRPSVFLAGAIYTNANGTLNDNVYEYDGVAFPFWADVGEVLARAWLGGGEEKPE
jgi:hypothetical protein